MNKNIYIYIYTYIYIYIYTYISQAWRADRGRPEGEPVCIYNIYVYTYIVAEKLSISK